MSLRARFTTSFGIAARAVVSFLSLAIALYALSYLFRREQAFPPNLVASFRARPWGIYPHALFGAIALALGSVQFWRGFPDSHPTFHRATGLGYVVATFVTGSAGLYMSFFAFGGTIPRVGFGLLAISVLSATALAWRRIRRRDIARHREWMLRSYALIFAAVTLRIELPILVGMFHNFTPAYTIVAWLCWLPNLVLAELYVHTTRPRAAARLRPA